MNPRRMTVEMWPTLVFGGGLAVLVTSLSLENAGAVRVADRLAPSLAANVGPVTRPTPIRHNPINADVADAAGLLAQVAVAPKPADVKQQAVVMASLSDPSEVLTQEMSSVQAAASANIDPPREAATAPDRIELVGECLVAEACIDQFLWALYERTPKLDTITQTEQTRVRVKRKGKMVTVTRSISRRVNNDFTWKDPKAAERIGMSMMDYVIGGMDKSFRLKLFRMLYAAESAGMAPGITSAFRDDYRQSIASGLKAASDRSYHGGSTHGGYGNGMAADIVSTKGATRAQRWITTEALWKWVDVKGAEYGIGRPYLDHDPPHVGPIDGKEYISKRGAPKTVSADDKKKSAGSGVKKDDKQATQDKAQEKPAAKRPVAAKASRARST